MGKSDPTQGNGAAVANRETTGAATAPPAKARRPRMPFLDGLRGFAALYVVMNHASIMTMKLVDGATGLNPIFAKILHILHFGVFNYGVYAVDVFIVLSGYCLMLPVASSADEQLQGGFFGFMKRRARRIIPPYYAALAICWIFFALAPLLKIDVAAMSWASLVQPVFSPGSVLSHLLLIHCWTPYRHAIDPPMWSVATEWNIYFLFPLLLLPVFKRWGSVATLAIAFGVSILPHYLGAQSLDSMYPWFLGLFALGMVGAVLNFSPRPAARAFAAKAPFGALAIGFGAVLAVLTTVQKESLQHNTAVHWLRKETWGSGWPFDIVVGLGAMCLICYCAKTAIAGKSESNALVRFFDAKPMMQLGAFSYSLYLFHAPVLEVMWLGLKKTVAPEPSAAIFLLAAAPVSVVTAYLFHLAFEKRFMTSHTKPATAPAAVPGDIVFSGAGEKPKAAAGDNRA